MIATRITRQFGLSCPIVCAGMGLVGMAPLAAAVSAAGAMGTVGAELLSPEAIAAAAASIRGHTQGAFGLNFITQFAEPRHIDAAIAARPAVVSFHWNELPVDHIRRVKDAGIAVWVQVGTVAMGAEAARLGVDAVIAQGEEAGGHVRGEAATMVLVPAMIDAVGPDIPVIASGGIADGRGLAAALALGADAVWVGTRFLASDEAGAHPEYKRRVLVAGVGDTMVTKLFGPEWPDQERVLVNRAAREWGARWNDVPQAVRDSGPIGQTLLDGRPYAMPKFSTMLSIPETTGDFEEMNVVAGQSSGLVHAVLPAAEIVRRMSADAEAILRTRLPALLAS